MPNKEMPESRGFTNSQPAIRVEVREPMGIDGLLDEITSLTIAEATYIISAFAFTHPAMYQDIRNSYKR
jgi:hypothetical protein